MTKWLWDGKIDCNWEELSDMLVTNCHTFTDVMAKTTEVSLNDESKKLISTSCMERFEQITAILSEIVKAGASYAWEDLDGTAQNASKLSGWILLGSLTETILQMFMAFYIDNYKEENWKQWEGFEIEQVEEPIFQCIQKLVEDNKLETRHAKVLKKAIRDKIKEHTKEHRIQKVMLDELIQLYQHLELMDEDDIICLRRIQSNRNGIHTFENREIGTWDEFRLSVRFFCYLLEWVIYHLPDISSYEDYY